MEHFSATDQEIYSSYSHSHTCQTVFHLFLSDHRKQYAATTAAHSKHIIYLLKYILVSGLSIIWEKTNGRYENYKYDTALYLLSILL